MVFLVIMIVFWVITIVFLVNRVLSFGETASESMNMISSGSVILNRMDSYA